MRRVLLAAFAASSLAVASPGRAQMPADAAEPERIRAAYAATHDPSLLLDLATSLRRLGRHAEAALAYEAWRADPRADPARAPAVEGALADVDRYVGRLTVELDDPLARVWLDGRELPGFRSGNAVRVDPGDHQVTAARDGGAPFNVTVRIGAREARTVQLRMGTYYPPPLATPPPPAPLPPLAPAPLPGPLAPVVVTTLPPADSSVEGPRLAGTLFLVGGGLGIAGGAAAGVAALVLEASSKSRCLGGGLACDQEGVDLQHQSRTAGTACTIALGGGGALMITGIVLRAVYGRPPRASGAATPLVRVGRAGPEVAW
jgi:hypothetical protein